jgi:hypothetical protein
MKLYLEHVFNDKSNEQLTKYNYKIDNTTLLFSNDGVLQIHKNKVNRLKIIDVPVEQLCIGEQILTCDKSKYVIDCEWFQIPNHHLVEKIHSEYHRLRPGALVDLIVETKTCDGSNKKRLVYFFIKNNELSHGVEEDINSFLEILKSNSQ